MAGLNDDVDEGLPSFEEDVIDVNDQLGNVDIPTNNPEQPDAPEVVLKTADNADSEDAREPTFTDLFGEGVIPGELPNFNGEFEIIRDQRDVLNDYNEVASDIQRKQSISQEDARSLDRIVPGLINEQRDIKFYTKDDTQTLLKESTLVMNKTMDEKEKELDERLKTHIDNLIVHYSSMVTFYNSGFKDKFIDQSKTIKEALNEVNLTGEAYAKLFNTEIKADDFFQIPIIDIDQNEITDQLNIKDILLAIKNNYKNVYVMSYLISFRYANAGSLVFVNPHSEEGVNLNDVFRIHQGDTQVILPDRILKQLIENEKSLTDLRNKAVIFHRREGDNTEEDLKETEDILVTLTQEYIYLYNLTTSLTMFNSAILSFINLFK